MAWWQWLLAFGLGYMAGTVAAVFMLLFAHWRWGEGPWDDEDWTAKRPPRTDWYKVRDALVWLALLTVCGLATYWLLAQIP